MTRALADSYRAELVRAARRGLAFTPATGSLKYGPRRAEAVTWYRRAVAYAEMKWPHLAAHSRASLADALATITPLVPGTPAVGRPGGSYAPPCTGMPLTPAALRPSWAGHGQRAGLRRAAFPCRSASSPTRRHPGRAGRAVHPAGRLPCRGEHDRTQAGGVHGALGYAVELGLLPANPADLVRWRAPRAAAAIIPAVVASPPQVRMILAEVSHVRPELAAFFGCLYYAARRPEEAVALRRDDLILPAHGRGKIILANACPRTGTAWTSTGGPHEARGLKHRPDGTIRVIPIPPVLVRMPCAVTCVIMAPRRTGGCSVEPAAACLVSPSTAVPGTPPARPRSARNWPPPRSPAARTTCGTPPCPCGSTPVARPPRSPHGPGTAPVSCMRSICTASTARTTSSASGSRTPSMQTSAVGRRHSA